MNTIYRLADIYTAVLTNGAVAVSIALLLLFFVAMIRKELEKR